MEDHLENEKVTVEVLAEECGMSNSHFYRKLIGLTNMPPKDFIRSYRMKKAAQYLKTSNYNVSEVAFKVGFSDTKYFSKLFKKQFGCSPSKFNQISK